MNEKLTLHFVEIEIGVSFCHVVNNIKYSEEEYLL